jgi:enamine deaminase RidA (YjgF/YER057c/UK114 family)
MFNPEGMAPAVGFSHGAIAAVGRTVYIAGQTGHQADLTIDDGMVEQFGAACRSVAKVIEGAGGAPTDLVSMTIYTPVITDYRENLTELGAEYQEVFGKHYPPMALLGVTELVDPKALVELVCVAVVPSD